MQTKMIGVKELRQNLATISNQVVDKKYRFVVLRKNKPIFELRPLNEKELYLEDIRRRIEEARKGKGFSGEEVIKMLGL